MEEDLLNPQLLVNNEALNQLKASLSGRQQTAFEHFVNVLREALNYSLTKVFLLCAAIVVVAFLFTLFLKEIPLRTSNETNPSYERPKEEIS